jgi:hypothetical protein
VNHVAIEPTDVLVDATVPFTGRDVKPQDRSASVRFRSGPRRSGGWWTKRRADQGRHRHPAATGVTVPVGYDGCLHRGPQPAEQPRDRAAAGFAGAAPPPSSIIPAAGEIPTIGPLRCELQR